MKALAIVAVALVLAACETLPAPARSACSPSDARCIVREEIRKSEVKRQHCRIVHGDNPILCP